ncbi:MAG: efflux RND transporter permease subunit [Chitinophagaceae bacterium]|jgi:multidrug efflux pump subunit AcrB|nr:MAG: efflux RND transporter permease subunit [Chitinophagaceae bacterium]
MVRFLIQRPVAVLMIFASLVLTGLILIKKIPVSLLPNIDVPQIVIHVNYPNASAANIEQNILKPIRESLVNINNLSSTQSRSSDHGGMLFLTFNYGTRMNLAYIEVNEKLDRLSSVLPRNLERPQVMRVNTSDVPVIRLQVMPKEGISYLSVSELCNHILKKRLEQIDGVSMVDINGRQERMISVQSNRNALVALGLQEADISRAIQSANEHLGSLSIKDGQYRYFVKVVNTLDNATDIGLLPVRLKNGAVISLHQVATIREEPQQQTGYHLYNGKEGLVITIQKQPDSRMNELVPRIQESVELFKKDYPQANFALTQDQTFLLTAGIDNLKQDLLYGGLLTVILLFMFLGNWASPALMSISIPLSLVITFIFFYLFHISFNIISLSGLALGIGMLIDNSIVVIDNITRKRKTGESLEDSGVNGTNEVITPVISQVLTTVAVYAPLILLSGMAGALVYDQSIALTISLMVSLGVAFILTPLLYKLLLKTQPDKLQEDTVFYKWVSRHYHVMIDHIFKRKKWFFLLTVLLMPIGILLAFTIPKSALPKIERKETLFLFDWNAPIEAQENLKRIKLLDQQIAARYIMSEAEIGISQFLLQKTPSTIEQSQLYLSFKSEADRISTEKYVSDWLVKHYPQASLTINPAPNAFTQLFQTEQPYLEARFTPLSQHPGKMPLEQITPLLQAIGERNYTLGEGLLSGETLLIAVDYTKMALYKIDKSSLDDALKQQFGVYAVSEIKRSGEVTPIQIKASTQDLSSKLETTVNSFSGAVYPLKSFITIQRDRTAKYITADKTGEYTSIVFNETAKDVPLLQKEITALALQEGFDVHFTGQYFENVKHQQTIWIIFFIVLFLLYCILAIQYEDLVQPLIVMLTIPLGITGGMVLLWSTGGTLDVMAAIGFVVVLGLIVDDPILKMETLNRLEARYAAEGLVHDEQLLKKMIHEAGDICLKPLLMVSLTTSIAMVPVIFIGGIGNELQRPLALVIIGGLTVGTFFTTWFTPLAYWYISKWRWKRKTTNQQQEL